MPSSKQSSKTFFGEKPQIKEPAPSHHKATTTAPLTGTAHTAPHHLVLDLSLPFHIINNHLLFVTYTTLRKLHRTVFGNDIIIEGYGDVHVHAFAGTKINSFPSQGLLACSIVSSSCTKVISQGMQVMLASHTPWMIFYLQKACLTEPQLPKYVPFTWDGENFVLKFQIPVKELGWQSAPAPSLSLHASLFRPFVGMAVSKSSSIPNSSLSCPVSPVCPLGPSQSQNSESQSPFIPLISPLQSPLSTLIPASFPAAPCHFLNRFPSSSPIRPIWQLTTTSPRSLLSSLEWPSPNFQNISPLATSSSFFTLSLPEIFWVLFNLRWLVPSSFTLCQIFFIDPCYNFKWLRQSSTVVGSKVRGQMSLEECKS